MKADPKFYVSLAVLLTKIRKDRILCLIFGLFSFMFGVAGLVLRDWFTVVVNMLAILMQVYFWTKYADLEEQIHQELLDWELKDEALEVGLPLNEKLLNKLHGKTDLENRTPEDQ